MVLQNVNGAGLGYNIDGKLTVDIGEGLELIGGKIVLRPFGGSSYPERYSKSLYQGLIESIKAAASTDGFTTIDCTAFTGNHVFPDTVTINCPVTILFGNVTITTQGKNFFNVESNNVKIIGCSRHTDRISTDDGNATTLIMTKEYSVTQESSTGYHIYSRGNKNCQYKNMTLKGVRSNIEDQVGNDTYPITGCGGIYIEKANPGTTEGGNTVNATTLENLLIDGTKAAGIYMDTPILSAIRNVRVSYAGGHGIYISGGTSVVLESVYVASANYAGLCLHGITYCTVLNSVAEKCGCGWWIRSCTNVSLFSPGVEDTSYIKNNPWNNAQPITKRYGKGLSTTSQSGTEVNINDVPNESWSIGTITLPAYNLFIGYGIVISGGKYINIYSPYVKSIASSSTGNGSLDDFKTKLAYMLVMGNARGIYITNFGAKENSGVSNLSRGIRREIGISSTVDGIELSYNPNDTTLENYSSVVGSDWTQTVCIYNECENALIHNGNVFYTDINFKTNNDTQ